jgi:hypothetical protein
MRISRLQLQHPAKPSQTPLIVPLRAHQGSPTVTPRGKIIVRAVRQGRKQRERGEGRQAPLRQSRAESSAVNGGSRMCSKENRRLHAVTDLEDHAVLGLVLTKRPCHRCKLLPLPCSRPAHRIESGNGERDRLTCSRDSITWSLTEAGGVRVRVLYLGPDASAVHLRSSDAIRPRRCSEPSVSRHTASPPSSKLL